MSSSGKIAAATILLLLGVEGVSATAETHAGWWAAGGFLCLLFVPALIFDAVVEKVEQRRQEREKRDMTWILLTAVLVREGEESSRAMQEKP